MDRRNFLRVTGIGMGTLLLPIGSRAIAAEELTSATMDVAAKKRLADVALNAAKEAGASYCDARIGRYLQQFVVTRENKVQNVVNTESVGIGIRVIAGGAWGFAATLDLTADAIAKAAKDAVAIAKANSKLNTEPVKLAPTKGVGEVSWKTPIVKNSMAVPLKDKVDRASARALEDARRIVLAADFDLARFLAATRRARAATLVSVVAAHQVGRHQIAAVGEGGRHDRHLHQLRGAVAQIDVIQGNACNALLLGFVHHRLAGGEDALAVGVPGRGDRKSVV